MNQLLLAQIFRFADATHQQATWASRLQRGNAYQMVSGHQAAMAAEVYEWIQGIGSWTDSSGYPYNNSIPEIIIPKQHRTVDRVVVPGGDFGLPGPANYNDYETMTADHPTPSD